MSEIDSFKLGYLVRSYENFWNDLASNSSSGVVRNIARISMNHFLGKVDERNFFSVYAESNKIFNSFNVNSLSNNSSNKSFEDYLKNSNREVYRFFMNVTGLL